MNVNSLKFKQAVVSHRKDIQMEKKRKVVIANFAHKFLDINENVKEFVPNVEHNKLRSSGEKKKKLFKPFNYLTE